MNNTFTRAVWMRVVFQDPYPEGLEPVRLTKANDRLIRCAALVGFTI